MINKKEISILFVEDEYQIRKNYVDTLKPFFKKVYEADNGASAYESYLHNKPQILIIDINIPKLNGLELIKKIRKNDKSTKIIILTAHKTTDYLIEAAELKLIKYLIKPVKRSMLNDALDTAIEEINSLEIINKDVLILKDDYKWSFKTKSLYQNNEEIQLTKKEKDILQLLFNNPSTQLTYDMITEDIWDHYDKSYINSLKTMIKNIRKKLPSDTIQTIYGIGYKFEIFH